MILDQFYKNKLVSLLIKYKENIYRFSKKMCKG